MSLRQPASTVLVVVVGIFISREMRVEWLVRGQMTHISSSHTTPDVKDTVIMNLQTRHGTGEALAGTITKDFAYNFFIDFYPSVSILPKDTTRL